MKNNTDQRCRDTRKLALAEAARLKRSTRRKLVKQAISTTGGSSMEVTSEMVTESLAKRNIDQIDDISRRFVRPGGYSRDDGNQKKVYSTLSQIPYKALKKQVAWLTQSQQEATSILTLSDELERFATYVRLDQQEVSARLSMLLDMEDVVRSKFPHACISQFGSYPVGLSVYSSDIDISVDNALAVAIEGPISELSAKRPPPGLLDELPRPNKRIRFDEGGSIVAEDGDASSGEGPEQGPGQVLVEEGEIEEIAEEEEEEEPVSWMIDADRGGSEGYSEGESMLKESGDCAEEAGNTDTDGGTKQRRSGKLPLDIDVPVWDGQSSSASNAALQGGDDGVLHDSAVDALMEGQGYGGGGSSSSSSREQREAAERLKREKLEVLSKVFRVIKSMGWVRRAELRRHARVPIINLVHRNGVECDISLDMSAQDTSVVVARLVERCGPALFTLSAFLKVYLGQLGLDAPFTGGLGSYKLYVLLAKHLLGGVEVGSQVQEQALGPQLMSFLKHYGSRRNLNKGTVVEVEGAEPVNFTGTMRIEQVADAFSVAHSVLSKTSGRGVAAQSRSAAVIVPRPNSNSNSQHSFLNSQLSHSHLAPLLNTAYLCSERAESRRLCQRHPQRTAAEREAVARAVLLELQRRVASNPAGLVPAAASYEEILQCNPALAARLRSFASVSSAVGHLAGLTSSKRSLELQSQFGGLIAPSATPAAITLPPAQPGSEQASASNPSVKQPSDPGAAMAGHVDARNGAGPPAAVLPELVDDPAVLAAIAELEASLTILVLQRHQPPAFFEPDSLWGQAIISRDRGLPPHMIIGKSKLVNRLPFKLVGLLGPFACLALAQLFVGKEAKEVRELQAREERAEQSLHQKLSSGELKDKRGPKERDFLRRCHIAALLPPKYQYVPQPALNPAEIRLLSVSKATRATIRSYVPAASADFGAEDLRVLVLMRQQDQQHRTAASQVREEAPPQPAPRELSMDDQACLAAHVNLNPTPVEVLVKQQAKWWADACGFMSAAKKGTLVRRKALSMHKRGMLPVPEDHPAFRHSDLAVYTNASAKAERLLRYITLRVERTGQQDLLKALASGEARFRAMAASMAVRAGQTQRGLEPSSASGSHGIREQKIARDIVDLTEDSEESNSGGSSADEEEEGEEGWEDETKQVEAADGTVDAAATAVEISGRKEGRVMTAVMSAGQPGPVIPSQEMASGAEEGQGVVSHASVMCVAVHSSASAPAPAAALALAQSTRHGLTEAEDKLEIPSLSKPNFGRRRSYPGQSSQMQQE